MTGKISNIRPTAAVSFVESEIKLVDNGKYTTGIFMDLSKGICKC